MEDVWEIVHRERLALINDLENLDDAQWNTASLCEGWSVHDVLAHLVNDAKTTKVNFVIAMIQARFNFDRLNQNGVNRERKANPTNTLAEFRSVANRTSSAPAPLATRFVETFVHGEDIRTPLRISHEYPVQAIVEGLKYQIATSVSMGGGKERVQDLHLQTTDCNFTHGDGKLLSGPALELLMFACGRPTTL